MTGSGRMPAERSPASFEEAAASRAAAAERQAVRIVGGATKLGWGARDAQPAVALRTDRLDSTLEHNAGDLTAIFAGRASRSRAPRRVFARAGQRLSLDPPLGRDGDAGATIGGMVATGDSGPLRHRYGGPRDLILGITVALGDGTRREAGGKVIKNVAGYDLAKLFAGSFGTLGLILSVNVRLHPLPEPQRPRVGATADPARAATAALALARGAARARGARRRLARRPRPAARPGRRRRGAEPRASDRGAMRELRARAGRRRRRRRRAVGAASARGQRSRERAIVRVAARPSELGAVLARRRLRRRRWSGARRSGTAIVELEPGGDRSGCARRCRRERSATVQDLPDGARDEVEPWGAPMQPALELMRRRQARFDPARTAIPGVFVGGI